MASRQLSKIRKIWTSNSTTRAVSLPPEACDMLGWDNGTDLSFSVDVEAGTLTLVRADAATDEAVA